MTDARIVRRAQQGDAAAYEEIVRRYQTVAFRTAWLILGDAEEARDATQSGFLNAWLHLHRLDPERPVQPWLLTIVANEARNRRRARSRWLARVLPEDRIDLLATADPSPEVALERQDDAAVILQQLQSMPETDRMTLWCRIVLDMSEQETADVMACPVGTVKSRTHRALDRLRERLRQTGMLTETVEGGERDV